MATLTIDLPVPREQRNDSREALERLGEISVKVAHQALDELEGTFARARCSLFKTEPLVSPGSATIMLTVSDVPGEVLLGVLSEAKRVFKKHWDREMEAMSNTRGSISGGSSAPRKWWQLWK